MVQRVGGAVTKMLGQERVVYSTPVLFLAVCAMSRSRQNGWCSDQDPGQVGAVQ